MFIWIFYCGSQRGAAESRTTVRRRATSAASAPIMRRLPRPGGLARVHFSVKTAALCGVEAHPIDAEVDISPAAGDAAAASQFVMVGLPDTAVRESRQRIRAAITN